MEESRLVWIGLAMTRYELVGRVAEGSWAAELAAFPTRDEAVARMRDALRRYPILGVTTNIAYLDAVLAEPRLAGDRRRAEGRGLV